MRASLHVRKQERMRGRVFWSVDFAFVLYNSEQNMSIDYNVSTYISIVWIYH